MDRHSPITKYTFIKKRLHESDRKRYEEFGHTSIRSILENMNGRYGDNWMQDRDRRDVSMYKCLHSHNGMEVNSKKNEKNPIQAESMCKTTFNGTLEEISHAYACSTEQLYARMIKKLNAKVAQVVILHPIVTRSSENPHHAMSIIWFLVHSSSPMIAPRDFCCLDAIDKVLDSDGNEVLVRVLQSIDLLDCHSLEKSHSFVRGKLRAGYIYRRDYLSSNLLHIQHVVRLEPNGYFPYSFASRAADSEVYSSIMQIRFLVQQQRISVDDFVERTQWIPNHLRSKCFICTKSFSAFRHRHHCRVCGEIMCGKCNIFRNIAMINGTMKAVRICIHCDVGLRRGCVDERMIDYDDYWENRDSIGSNVSQNTESGTICEASLLTMDQFYQDGMNSPSSHSTNSNISNKSNNSNFSNFSNTSNVSNASIRSTLSTRSTADSRHRRRRSSIGSLTSRSSLYFQRLSRLGMKPFSKQPRTTSSNSTPNIQTPSNSRTHPGSPTSNYKRLRKSPPSHQSISTHGHGNGRHPQLDLSYLQSTASTPRMNDIDSISRPNPTQHLATEGTNEVDYGAGLILKKDVEAFQAKKQELDAINPLSNEDLNRKWCELESGYSFVSHVIPSGALSTMREETIEEIEAECRRSTLCIPENSPEQKSLLGDLNSIQPLATKILSVLIHLRRSLSSKETYRHVLSDVLKTMSSNPLYGSKFENEDPSQDNHGNSQEDTSSEIQNHEHVIDMENCTFGNLHIEQIDGLTELYRLAGYDSKDTSKDTSSSITNCSNHQTSKNNENFKQLVFHSDKNSDFKEVCQIIDKTLVISNRTKSPVVNKEDQKSSLLFVKEKEPEAELEHEQPHDTCKKSNQIVEQTTRLLSHIEI